MKSGGWSLPGTASEPVIHGTTLLVTVDGSLVALDLAAPSAPAELSRTPVAGENPSMHRAVGQHAFVLVGRAMRVFDVHDPRNPRLLDHIVSTPRGRAPGAARPGQPRGRAPRRVGRGDHRLAGSARARHGPMTKDTATMNRNRSPYDVLLVLALLAAPAAGCGDTPAMGEQRMLGADAGQRARGPEPLEALREEFEAYVETVNSCAADSECTVIFPGCPLGCFVAVPEARRKEIEAKAQKMLTEFNGDGTVCVYSCAANSPVACTERRCTSNPAPGP